MATAVIAHIPQELADQWTIEERERVRALINQRNQLLLVASDPETELDEAAQADSESEHILTILADEFNVTPDMLEGGYELPEEQPEPAPAPTDDPVPVPQGQLTFNLGLGRGVAPTHGTLAIKGNFAVYRDLLYQQHVTVTVTDGAGEVIATGPATLGYPAFKDGKEGLIERVHAATLD